MISSESRLHDNRRIAVSVTHTGSPNRLGRKCAPTTPNELLAGAAEEKFACRVLRRLQATPHLNDLFASITQATHGDFYIFGGTLRRTLMESEFECDVDIMVPNHDNRVFDRLAVLGVPYSLNRRRHHRYNWNGLQLDINQPQEWRDDFVEIVDVLSHFDLRINSLAIHVGSHTVLDPFRLIGNTPPATPGINWQRWNTMPPLEIAILAIRLHKIMMQCPSLAISVQDSAQLRQMLPASFARVKWHLVRDRFPAGKAAFWRAFESTVLSRVTSLAAND